MCDYVLIQTNVAQEKQVSLVLRIAIELQIQPMPNSHESNFCTKSD